MSFGANHCNFYREKATVAWGAGPKSANGELPDDLLLYCQSISAARPKSFSWVDARCCF
jgi:hypothetical protein